MTPASEPRLVVRPDLDLQVTAPDGRRASVRLGGGEELLRVDVHGLPVVLASLPRLGRDGTARQLLAVGARVRDVTGATWAQDVEVRVGDRVVLRRSGGSWRPTTAVVAPAVAAAAGVVSLVAGLVAAFLAVRRSLTRG